MKKERTVLKVLILIFVLILSFACSLCFGAEKPTLFLVRYLRLPRSILVLLSGALLASSGAVFQMFFRNPLAEPGLLGISAGATLGAVTAACLGGLSFFGGILSSINIFAFAGAFISGLILALISSSNKRVNSVILLLCGTALGSLYAAISSTVMLMHNKELYGIFSWLLGSFNGRGINELKFILVPSVLAFLLMALICNPLDLLNGGEDNASALGVNVSFLRLMVILSGSLAVSVAVCAGGTISFVGLIAPHIMRKLFSPKSKKLIFTSALGGAVLLLLADTVARVVMKPGELPCGIVTSFIGVPFFLCLIFQNRKRFAEKPVKENKKTINRKQEKNVNKKIDSLVLNNFSFSYFNGNQVLSNISVSMNPGDFICLCGKNGSGKSTLLNALSENCGLFDVKEKAKSISFLYQNETSLWDYSVFDTVLEGRFCHTGKLGNYSKEDYLAAETAIKEFGLENLAQKNVREISGGEFQKVRLARSFAQGSDFLLLDEPLSSLDFIASANLMNLLKEKCQKFGKSVLVSIHDINTASRYADKVILLGKCNSKTGEQVCYQGTVNDVFTSEKLTKAFYSDSEENTEKVKVWIHPELKVPQI